MLENIKFFAEIIILILGTVTVISAFFIAINIVAKVDEFFSKKSGDDVGISKKEILKSLPPPERLEVLASWIDALHPNDKNVEVQNDLRTWANNLRKLKEKLN